MLTVKMSHHRILRGFENNFFEDTICELYLGLPQNWGPASFSKQIVDLFWSDHLKYEDRFKLCLFEYNNPLDPEVFFKWLSHRRMLRDKHAWDHVHSLFKNWKAGKSTNRYETYSIISNQTQRHARPVEI